MCFDGVVGENHCLILAPIYDWKTGIEIGTFAEFPAHESGKITRRERKNIWRKLEVNPQQVAFDMQIFRYFSTLFCVTQPASQAVLR